MRSFASDPQEDGSDVISWICPQCSQPHEQRVQRDSTWTGLSAGPDARTGELALTCDCGLAHPERPDGEVGCGYRTILLLEESEE